MDIYAIVNAFWTREIAGETAFTPVERALLDVLLVEAEVNNGGFHQYFFNSAGDRALPAIASLEAIAAPVTAAILREACAFFADGRPSGDRFTRQQELFRVAPRCDEFRALDERFFAYPEPLEQLMATYWLAHERDR